MFDAVRRRHQLVHPRWNVALPLPSKWLDKKSTSRHATGLTHPSTMSTPPEAKVVGHGTNRSLELGKVDPGSRFS